MNRPDLIIIVELDPKDCECHIEEETSDLARYRDKVLSRYDIIEMAVLKDIDFRIIPVEPWEQFNKQTLTVEPKDPHRAFELCGPLHDFRQRYYTATDMAKSCWQPPLKKYLKDPSEL